MKISTLILLLLLFHIHSVNAQNEIRGILIDKNSSKPVAYATVYINGTSNGTISNADGNFSLKQNNFPYKLIIRHLGYERVVFNLDKAVDLKQIKLNPQIQAINEIQIEAENHREENLKLFREAFLGTDRWGQKTEILNEDDIKFYRKDIIDTKFGLEFTLVANCNVPLNIHLPLLGYYLDFDMLLFELGPLTQSYQGYYYYRPINNLSRQKAKTALKNREKVYYNSSMHFIRSLYYSFMNEQGYLVCKKSLDIEKREEKLVPIELDSSLVEFEDSKYVNLLKDKQFHIFYYSQKGKPFDFTQKVKNLPKPQQSEIKFLSDSCIIRKDGTLPDISTMFSGTIGRKHIGASLPADYSPPENEHQ